MTRKSSAPYLDLRDLGEGLGVVRRRFAVQDYPHVYVAEAYSPCGCGFPEERAGAKERRRSVPPEERATMERLAQALRPAVKGRPRVQLLLCWIGTEDDPVSIGRTLGLAELGAPGFRFRNGEILTVLKAALQQPAATSAAD